MFMATHRTRPSVSPLLAEAFLLAAADGGLDHGWFTPRKQLSTTCSHARSYEKLPTQCKVRAEAANLDEYWTGVDG